MVLAPAPRSDDREESGRLAATQMENAGCTWPRTANVPGRARFRPSQFLTLPGRRGSRRADSIRSSLGLVGSLPVPSGLRETESLVRLPSLVEPTPRRFSADESVNPVLPWLTISCWKTGKRQDERSR